MAGCTAQGACGVLCCCWQVPISNPGAASKAVYVTAPSGLAFQGPQNLLWVVYGYPAATATLGYAVRATLSPTAAGSASAALTARACLLCLAAERQRHRASGVGSHARLRARDQCIRHRVLRPLRRGGQHVVYAAKLTGCEWLRWCVRLQGDNQGVNAVLYSYNTSTPTPASSMSVLFKATTQSFGQINFDTLGVSAGCVAAGDWRTPGARLI